MSIAIFVDGYFAYKSYQPKKLDLLKLRNHLAADLGDTVEEAIYFCSETQDPGVQRYRKALSLPPPTGPGFRVKEYPLEEFDLHWPSNLGGQTVIHPTSGTPYLMRRAKAAQVGLAFHLGRSIANRRWDRLVLFAGDSAYQEPVQHLVEYDGLELCLVGTLAQIKEPLRGFAKKIYFVDEEPLNRALEWSP